MDLKIVGIRGDYSEKYPQALRLRGIIRISEEERKGRPLKGNM